VSTQILASFTMSTMSVPLGPDPELETPPNFKIFMSDVIQECMLEVTVADSAVTRAVQTKDEVLQELTTKWEASRAVYVANYKQQKKVMEQNAAAAAAQKAKDNAAATADSAAELQRLANEDLRKLPWVPNITKAGAIPDKPTV
jgi:hypothetical protein